MAEGILHSLVGDILDVRSAGSHPSGYVHPVAIEVMREIDIDISGNESKSLENFLHQPIHTVITVCGNVDQICPDFPGQAQRIHHGFDDPAHTDGSPEEIHAAFRRVRDEIGEFIRENLDQWCMDATNKRSTGKTIDSGYQNQSSTAL